MRFIGSKRLLITNIKNIIEENIDSWQSLKSFCDIFAGTSTVGRNFKQYFKVISNDILYFSYVLQRTGIQLNKEPSFKGLKKIGISNPLDYLNNIDITHREENMFILENYTP